MKNIIISVACASLMLAACSIKEDRDPCPCTLVVDLSGCDEPDMDLSLWRDGNLVSRKRVSGRDTVSMDVQRDFYYLSVYPSRWKEMMDAEKLCVSMGQQFVHLMSCSSFLDAFDDRVCEKVVLHKQYARLVLDASDLLNINSGWDFVVTSDVCGVDMMTMSPVKGAFEHRMTQEGDNLFSTVIPRHSDSSPEITLFQGGKYVCGLNVPTYLKSIGYDWNAPDLEDIHINISALALDVDVSVGDWDGVNLNDGVI